MNMQDRGSLRNPARGARTLGNSFRLRPVLLALALLAAPAAGQGAFPAALVPYDTAEVDLNLEVAEGFLVEGRLDAAEAALERVLELDPSSARGRFNRARLDLSRGRFDSAEVALSLLAQTAKDSLERDECLVKRALALLHLERTLEARTVLAAMTVDDPALRLERTWLSGVAAFRLGEKETATERFAEALALAHALGGDAMRGTVQEKIDALKSPARIK